MLKQFSLFFGLCLWLFLIYPIILPVHASATLVSNLSATASTTQSNSNVTNLLDNNPITTWNAGQAAPAWIMLNLTQPSTINQLKLTTNQSSSGRLTFTISGGSSPTSLRHLTTIDQITTNKQVLTIPLLSPASNIMYLKIETTRSPSWVSWSDISVYAGANNANTHLKYYGYMSHDGLVSDIAPTYFSEILALGNTNIAWATSANSRQFSDQGLIPMITDQKWVFFDSNGSLNPNWQTNWNNLKNRLGNADHIYGFYFDEPVWRGYTKEAFLAATRTIKQDYPTKAIVVVEAAPPIQDHTIPDGYYQYVTDIGFDYYYTTHGNDWGTYLSLFEDFRPYTVGKKIWLIPDGSGDYKDNWSEAYEKYLSFALVNNQVIGIMGFLYQWPTDNLTLRSSLIPGQPFYNPSFRTRQIEIGKSIISTNINSKPGDLNADSHVNYADFSELISNFGNPYTIADFNDILINYGT